MSKIFEFRPGSYIDKVSGVVGVNTNGSFERTEKGLAWRGNGVSSKVSHTGLTPFGADDFSIEGWLYLKDITSAFFINHFTSSSTFAQCGTNGFGYPVIYIRIGGTTLILVAGNNEVPKNKWFHFIASVDRSGQTSKYYIDGILDTNSGVVTSTEITFTSWEIGYDGQSTRYIDGNIGRVQFYDHILTEKERVKLYQEFLQATPTTKIIQ